MIWRLWIVLSILAVLLSGCAGQAAVIRELAKDPTTSCIDVQASYLAAFNLRTRWYRTGAKETGGSADSTIDVLCKDDGMAVKRTRDVEPKPR